jgi:hypothetical protein
LARQVEAKTAIGRLDWKEPMHSEYAEQYEAAIEDVEHALRRGCNRLRDVAKYANQRAETNNAAQGRPTKEDVP